MTSDNSRLTQKISVKVWRPIVEKLDKRMSAACLRRDAYLTRVLEVELKQLDEEVRNASSEMARTFITNKLEAMPDRKLVSLTLRTDLVERLGEICERKRIVRDSFLNRLLLLLSASTTVFDHLLNLDQDWKRKLLREYKNETFFENTFYPIEDDINPFWAVRDWIDLNDPTGQSDDEGIYTTFWGEERFNNIDLTGLNCFVHDWRIPNHPAEIARRKDLDELLTIL
jgi:hypothetical protein